MVAEGRLAFGSTLEFGGSELSRGAPPVHTRQARNPAAVETLRPRKGVWLDRDLNQFLKGECAMHFSYRGSPPGAGGWDLTQSDLLFCSLPIVVFLSIVSLV